MCLHEPATPHFNQDYPELSGFQNCRWGLRHYLLHPNPVVQYFTCRLQGHTAHVNLSVKCVCQQRSSAAGLTHDVNLLRENQYCPDWSRWRCEVFLVLDGGFEDIWLLPLMKDFFLMLSKQQHTSSREKPPYKNRHPAGVKGQGTPCQSEERSDNRGLRPSASWNQTNSLGFGSSSPLVSAPFLIAASAQLRWFSKRFPCINCVLLCPFWWL